jgi:hypothetical protein
VERFVLGFGGVEKERWGLYANRILRGVEDVKEDVKEDCGVWRRVLMLELTKADAVVLRCRD